MHLQIKNTLTISILALFLPVWIIVLLSVGNLSHWRRKFTLIKGCQHRESDYITAVLLTLLDGFKKLKCYVYVYSTLISLQQKSINLLSADCCQCVKNSAVNGDEFQVTSELPGNFGIGC